MAAVNPRITITLTPQVHALLRRLSELTGNSQSGIVSELLESSQPVFERMVSLLAAAARLKAEGMQATDDIRDSLATAQARLGEQLGLVLEAVDEGGRPLLDQAERLSRRSGPAKALGAGAGRSAPLLTPVPVTRGSGTPTKRQAAGRRGTGRGVSRG